MSMKKTSAVPAGGFTACLPRRDQQAAGGLEAPLQDTLGTCLLADASRKIEVLQGPTLAAACS